MTTLQQIQDRVAQVLLEDGGPSLGIVATDLSSKITSVLQDFMMKSGLFKRIDCIPAEFGQHRYSLPESFSDPMFVFHDGTFLHRTHHGSLDGAEPDWMGKADSPVSWRNDRLSLKDIEIHAAPLIDGRQVETDVAGFYGTIGECTAGQDVTVLTSDAAGFYGVISNDQYGEVFLDTEGPLLGTIADLVASPSNLAVFGTATLKNAAPALTGMIEMIPDSFMPYIVFGVLERLFEQDGEVHDDLRAGYCHARYNEGVNMAQSIVSDGLLMEE